MTRLVAPDHLWCDGRLQPGLAAEIGPEGIRRVRPLARGETPDARPHLLMPACADLQVNGSGGVMMNNSPTPEAVAHIVATQRRLGTGWTMPTLITSTAQQMAEAADAVIAAWGLPGLLGLHLEGPHLNPARKGTHDAALIRPLDLATIRVLEASPRQSDPHDIHARARGRARRSPARDRRHGRRRLDRSYRCERRGGARRSRRRRADVHAPLQRHAADAFARPRHGCRRAQQRGPRRSDRGRPSRGVGDAGDRLPRATASRSHIPCLGCDGDGRRTGTLHALRRGDRRPRRLPRQRGRRAGRRARRPAHEPAQRYAARGPAACRSRGHGDGYPSPGHRRTPPSLRDPLNKEEIVALDADLLPIAL